VSPDLKNYLKDLDFTGNVFFVLSQIFINLPDRIRNTACQVGTGTVGTLGTGTGPYLPPIL